VLGRERLVIWLGLLLVTDGAHGGVRTELITLSLVRARMCELLANASGIPRAHGPLFLVGILSALDQLLETPMDVLADALDLSSDFRTALLQRDDYFGTVLRLVEAYEQGMWDHAGDLAGSIGVDMVSLSPLYLDSLAWANEQQRASGDVNPFAGHLSDRPESRAESVHNRRAARLR
jgi:EAL and modified HD-GYP domain-containing signal transduction protein